MNYGYMVIYKKANGELLYRAHKTTPHYSKGESTSMGWTVIDVQRMHNGKVFTDKEYNEKLAPKRKFIKIINWINRFDIKKLVEIALLTAIIKLMV